MDPTPQQIREMCLDLQKTWSDLERAWRSGSLGEFAWTPPQYLVHHGEIGRSHHKKHKETRVWERIG